VSWRIRAGVPGLATLVLFVAGGSAAGVLWQHWWKPVTGTVVSHKFFLDGTGLQRDFGGTGLYVLIAVVAGTVLGLCAGGLARRHELIMLVVVLVSAVLGGWLMAAVGHALGPPDPSALARSMDDYSTLPADLRVTGHSPYLALPAGAILGLGAEFFLEALIRAFRRTGGNHLSTLDV